MAIGRRPTVLAHDFDRALYVDQVHAATFLPPGATSLLRVGGFFVEHALGVAILLLAGLVWGIAAIAEVVRRRVLRNR